MKTEITIHAASSDRLTAYPLEALDQVALMVNTGFDDPRSDKGTVWMSVDQARRAGIELLRAADKLEREKAAKLAAAPAATDEELAAMAAEAFPPEPVEPMPAVAAVDEERH